MVNFLKNVSINKKLMAVIIFMLLLSTVNFAVINYFNGLRSEDGAIIDASGRNRMLSQRIGFYAEQVVNGDESAKSELNEIINLHETSFYALKNGGVAPGIANDRILPASPENILPLVDSAEELWLEYRDQARIIASQETFVSGEVKPEVKDALIFLEENGPEMLSRNNAMVAAYVVEDGKKQSNLNLALIVMLVLSLVITVIGFLIIISVSKPIKVLENFAEDVGDGNIKARLPANLINRKDEIGDVAKAFKKLVKNAETGIERYVDSKFKKK